MPDIMEWRPFREVSRLRRDMDRLWEDYFGPGRRGCPEKFKVQGSKLGARPFSCFWREPTAHARLSQEGRGEPQNH